MKTLYLIRHAKSEWATETLSDVDRPLNSRGYSDADKMSLVLKSKKIVPDLIISSPAVRAITTALIFCRNLNYDPDKLAISKNLYATSVKDYLHCISGIDDSYHTVLLIGHNPIISNTANALASSLENDMPTCSIVGITGEVDTWKSFAKRNNSVKMFDFPKNHT